ncbi:hypothetical protein XENTR_v10001136 [Xenopus tropicalis]|nr:hypothetical protein XENTR_v10001136 [Xenopus tropicalis]
MCKRNNYMLFRLCMSLLCSLLKVWFICGLLPVYCLRKAALQVLLSLCFPKCKSLMPTRVIECCTTMH